MKNEKPKRKSLLKRIATSAVAVACMFSLAQPFGSILKAEAIAPDPVDPTPMELAGFPTTTDLVSQAAQLLGKPYVLNGKGCDPNTLESTNKTLYTAAEVGVKGGAYKGIDCSGLVFWTMAQLGYKTSGFANNWNTQNSPVPTAVGYWLDTTGNTPKKIGFDNGNTVIPLTEITFQKSKTVSGSQPSDPTEWWKLSNGGEIAPGSVVFADRPNTEQGDHCWIYIGKFDTKADVINYLVNNCGVSQTVAEANTVEQLSGNPYWRIEATSDPGDNGSGRVIVSNGKSAKGGSTFTITSANITREDKGSLIINKKIKPVESGEFAADSNHVDYYSNIKFALRVKAVEGLTTGKYVQLTKDGDGIYKVGDTPVLLDSATASGAEGTIGANGVLKIQNLEPGTYTLVETTNVSFLNNAEDQDVVVAENSTTNAESYNVINEVKYGNIEVIKYSAELNGEKNSEINANVLEKATFIIRNTTTPNTPYVNATGTNGDYTYHGLYGGRSSATNLKLTKNNDNGYLIVKNLPMYNADGTAAKYEIEETETDSEFVLASKEVDIQFATHKETVTKEIVNAKAPTNFDVTKQFILGTVGAGQVSDAMYGEIKFIAKASNGKYLSMNGNAANGYTFNGFVDAEADATVMNLDATSHKANLGGLPKDTYTVVEKVDIAKYAAKQGTANAQSTVDGTNSAILINSELTGGFEIYKKTATMKNVSGIQFRIHGTTVTGRAIDARTSGTDETGYLKVEGLPYGTYTLEECADTVDGSYTLAAPQTIVINKPFAADADKKEIKNEFRSGEIELGKQNKKGAPLAEFVFTLTAEEDIYEGPVKPENLLYAKGEEIEQLTTGEDGKAQSTAVLPFGYIYKITETEAKAPYTNDGMSYTFRLDDDGQGNSVYRSVDEDGNVGNEAIPALTFTNEQQQGSLTIYKVDAKNNKKFLSGAEFDVIALEDIVVDGETLYKKGETVAQGATGEDGTAKFEKLYTNFKYGLKETKAPDGYTLNADITEVDMKFDINLLYTEQEVSITNSEVPKTGNNVSTVPVIFAGIGAVVALGAIIIIARKKKSAK